MTNIKEITAEDINHLAELTRLELTQEESNKYAVHMNATVHFIENLQELKTDDIEPTNNGLATENVFFEDGKESSRTLTQEQALKNAKNKTDAFFVVKKIM